MFHLHILLISPNQYCEGHGDIATSGIYLQLLPPGTVLKALYLNFYINPQIGTAILFIWQMRELGLIYVTSYWSHSKQVEKLKL